MSAPAIQYAHIIEVIERSSGPLQAQVMIGYKQNDEHSTQTIFLHGPSAAAAQVGGIVHMEAGKQAVVINQTLLEYAAAYRIQRISTHPNIAILERMDHRFDQIEAMLKAIRG